MKKSINTNRIYGIFTAFFVLLGLSYPPSVFSQKIVSLDEHFPQVSVLKVGAGLFRPHFDGRYGMSIGMAYENSFARHASWLVNTDLMFNPAEDVFTQKGVLRPNIQTRFVIQPEFRYYPKLVLKRLHIGFAAGFASGYGKYAKQINDNVPPLKSFTEEIIELKFGWQQPFRKEYVWNVFASFGGLIPNDKDLEEARFIPLLRCGLLVGTQR